MNKKNKQTEINDNKKPIDKIVVSIIIFLVFTMLSIWYYEDKLNKEEINRDMNSQQIHELQNIIDELRSEIKKAEIKNNNK